jgi:hypothetical protein
MASTQLTRGDGTPAATNVEFTEFEQRFLEDYTSHLQRTNALTTAGMSLAEQAAEGRERAKQIIAKAESLGLEALATACGADKLYLIHHVKRAVEAESIHDVCKGLMLLGRIHGLYDKERKVARPVTLIFGSPPSPNTVNGERLVNPLPFVLQVDAEE